MVVVVVIVVVVVSVYETKRDSLNCSFVLVGREGGYWNGGLGDVS